MASEFIGAGWAFPLQLDQTGGFALVTEDRGKQPFAVEAVERVGIGVTNTRRHDLDQHFARLGPFEVDFDDLERALGFESDGGAGLHILISIPVAVAMP